MNSHTTLPSLDRLGYVNLLPAEEVYNKKEVEKEEQSIYLKRTWLIKVLEFNLIFLQKAAPEQYSLILCVGGSDNSNIEPFNLFKYLEMIFKLGGGLYKLRLHGELNEVLPYLNRGR